MCLLSFVDAVQPTITTIHTTLHRNHLVTDMLYRQATATRAMSHNSLKLPKFIKKICDECVQYGHLTFN